MGRKLDARGKRKKRGRAPQVEILESLCGIVNAHKKISIKLTFQNFYLGDRRKAAEEVCDSSSAAEISSAAGNIQAR